jgi:hypothetical protein
LPRTSADDGGRTGGTLAGPADGLSRLDMADYTLRNLRQLDDLAGQ